MAVPTITEDFTDWDDAENVSTWSGWGANASKWDDEGDIYKEGTQSVGLQPSSTGDSGFGVYKSGTTFDATSNIILIWVYITPGFVLGSGSYGVYVRIGSGTGWTADYEDYLVGGSDVAWVGKGWHLIALDAGNRAADRSNGSPSLTACNRIGVGFNVAATASKSTVLAIDLMQYGTSYAVTGVSSSDSAVDGLDFNDNGASADTITRSDGGSFVTDGWEAGDMAVVSGTSSNDGEYEVVTVAAATLTLSTGDLAATELNVTAAFVDAPISFADIIAKDEADDSWFGIVQRNPDGDIVINGPLTIGDASSTARTLFRSRNERVVKADQPITPVLEFVEGASAWTQVEIGQSTGTGDDRVGFAGSLFTVDNVFLGEGWSIDFSDAIDALGVFGTTFSYITEGVLFANDSGHYVTNCEFKACGQVDVYAVECRNLTFSGFVSTTSAALLWRPGVTDTAIKNSRFLANSRAILHTTSGTATYNALFFSGNDYDVRYTAATGNLVVTKAYDSDPSTYEATGAGSVTFSASFIFEVVGLEYDSEVTIVTAGTTTVLYHLESATVSDGAGKYKISYTHSGGATVDVLIHHVDYVPDISNIYGLTLPNANSEAKVAMFNDENYENP